VRSSIQPAKHCLGVTEFIVCQPCDGGTNASFTLETLDFQHLPFGFRLGASGEVLADALTIQPTGNAENDFPGGIREF
jgi:hypothetical protein